MHDNETKMEELRLDKGLKQKELAKILNVKTYRYSQWERGINDIPIDMCNNLVNFYGVSFDFLFGLIDHNMKTENKDIDFNLMCQRLYELRKEHNLTQKQLGLKVGFPQRTYANYESGKSKPTTFKIYYIALFYKVSIDYILGKSDIKNIE